MSHMSDMPAPETRRAIIPSAGIASGRPTVHRFHHTEEVPWVDEVGKPDGTHFVHVFKCEITGATRRWGGEQ